MSNKMGITAIAISAVSLSCSAVCLFFTLNKTPESSNKADDLITQYVMYVGTNDKDTYQPEHTHEEAHAIVDAVCLKYFPDGYTLQEATGAWTDDKNNITHEYTLVCYFDGAERENVYKAADEVIVALNQSSVLIEQDNISIDYYSGK